MLALLMKFTSVATNILSRFVQGQPAFTGSAVAATGKRAAGFEALAALSSWGVGLVESGQ
jgi:hypothetical protein